MPLSSASASIAAVESPGDSSVQALFAELAKEWSDKGVKVAGVVEEAHGLEGRVCTSGTLVDIATGQRFPIYRETIPEGATCHIDAAGAANACETVLHRLKDADILVLSKYGKLEAGGAGLRAAFDAAIASGTPVLTTVSSKHMEEWVRLAPAAVFLPPDRDTIRAWMDGATAPAR